MLEAPPRRWLWQGLLSGGCAGPSWLVPSCSFLMCRTTAVALKACCRAHGVHHHVPAPLCAPPPAP